MLADKDVPLQDSSFAYGPMSVTVSFTHGLSTYPFSRSRTTWTPWQLTSRRGLA